MDAELRAKLEYWVEYWDLPMPMTNFLSTKEIYRGMEVETHRLGPSAATELAKALVQLEAEDDPLLEILDEFLEIYFRHYPDALSEALLPELRPTGSPSLVGLLGCTGNAKAVTQLKKILLTGSLGRCSGRPWRSRSPGNVEFFAEEGKLIKTGPGRN